MKTITWTRGGSQKLKPKKDICTGRRYRGNY